MIVAALVCAAVLVAGCSSDAAPVTSTNSAGSAGEPQGTVTYNNLSRNHVSTPVNYAQTPPVGGDHSPIWQQCQFYSTPIVKEQGVHSMEHGAVWITYQPTLPADQITVLKALSAPGADVLVTPWPGLPTPVVASAWGKQLQLQSAADPRLAQFVSYFANGPQTPEVGASCEGGTTATP